MIPLPVDNTDSQKDYRLPLHLIVRVRSSLSSSSSGDLPAVLRQLARVQVATSLLAIVFIALFIYTGHWIDIRVQLPRLLALFATGIVTDKAFVSSERFSSPQQYRPHAAFHHIALALQILWLVSEFVFTSAFAPLIVVAVPSLQLSSPGAIAIRLFPASAMFTFASCIEFFTKLRRRRRHRSLASVNSDDLNKINASNSYYMIQHAVSQGALSDGYSTPPLSPADSYASGSSGALNSGLPSPTGHCPSPDRKSMLRHAASSPATATCDIYLMPHVIDTNESMLFVHKKLKPIKTRMGDQIPLVASYRPLVNHLTEQAMLPGKAGSPLAYPAAVTATVTLVKKGTQVPVITSV